MLTGEVPARRMLGADFAAPERLFQLLDGSAMDSHGEHRALDRGAPQGYMVVGLLRARRHVSCKHMIHAAVSPPLSVLTCAGSPLCNGGVFMN